jgi:hypothetical protein
MAGNKSLKLKLDWFQQEPGFRPAQSLYRPANDIAALLT